MDFLFNGLAALAGMLVGGTIFYLVILLDRYWSSCRVKRAVTSLPAVAEERYWRYCNNAAYWFSEDIPTFKLLRGLAEERDLNMLRDEWRKDRAANPSVSPIVFTEGPRTKSQVLALRRSHIGCCARFSDNQGCDCLEEAADG